MVRPAAWREPTDLARREELDCSLTVRNADPLRPADELPLEPASRHRRKRGEGRKEAGEAALGHHLGSLEEAPLRHEWAPLTGKAVTGALEGRELKPLVSTHSLWFAWKKYRPDTVVHGEPN